MTKKFNKKWFVWFSYVYKEWIDCDSCICSRIYGGFNALLRLSTCAIAILKIDNVKRILVQSVTFTECGPYSSRRLMHSLIKMGEQPQSWFQLIMIIAACLVIVSIIDSRRLLAKYPDQELYSATVEHNQNDARSITYTYVKQTDNKTANLVVTDLENNHQSRRLDSKENSIEGENSFNTIKTYMYDEQGIRDVTVAILDTGIDNKHEDLIDKVVDEVDFTKSGSPTDHNGHGTHIAGIVAADADNDLGLMGVAPQAKLLNVKVADVTGMCNNSIVAAGIVWAVDNGANIINISLEMRDTSEELENAIDYAWESGCLIVAATNFDSESLVYPACYERCIAVTVNGRDNTIIPLVENGSWVDIEAPGRQIYSTLPHNSYGMKSGASCSTAFVSSIAALLFSTLDDNSGDGKLNDEVRILIESNCFEISP